MSTVWSFEISYVFWNINRSLASVELLQLTYTIFFGSVSIIFSITFLSIPSLGGFTIKTDGLPFSLIKACETLVKFGAKDVIAIVTHGILSGQALERINSCECLKKIIVSNTIPQDYNLKNCSKLSVFTVEDLLAEAIQKLHSSESMSDLFVLPSYL